MEYKKQMYLNYKRQNKFLGIIDYKSMLFIFAYSLILIYILSLIKIDIAYKAYILSFALVPLLTIIFLNTNNKSENAIDIIFIILKYLISKKEYIFSLDNQKDKYFKYKEYKNIDN